MKCLLKISITLKTFKVAYLRVLSAASTISLNILSRFVQWKSCEDPAIDINTFGFCRRQSRVKKSRTFSVLVDLSRRTYCERVIVKIRMIKKKRKNGRDREEEWHSLFYAAGMILQHYRYTTIIAHVQQYMAPPKA